jgi:maleate isomerase
MSWRVGLLVPAPNAVMEVDMYRRLPHDATLHVARLYASDLGTGDDESVDRFMIPAVNALASVIPHVVAFDSHSMVSARGAEDERALADRIGELTGAVAVGVHAATFDALREAHASRVAVVSPYNAAMNRRLAASLEAGGMTISALHGMGLSEFESAALSADAVYTFVQSSIGPRVRGDALLLAGTNVAAMSALSLIEISYDVPVVTSNLAVLQAVTRELRNLRQRELAQLSP